jgi:eukaryotic-like serine/threonine-protein kinase
VERSLPSRFGPYDVIAPVGAGGMGEVYRARDTRLRRDVALKILPPLFAIDPDRRRRFTNEAQAAAALNHPNILAVHDIGVDNGTPFLITELIDGHELRQELDRGQMPFKRLLDIAAQIAAGLQAAHAAGLVHRDLKPENVMVTGDGRVKILDFGLATSFLPSAEDGARAARETRTQSGLVAGTAPYMSPEQARGGAVDYRSDQFSFGLMLYEMVTGIHPFRRASGVETMAAIIAEEPRPIAELNPRAPTIFRWIVERCLAKDPAERYASTADLARDLATLRGRLSEIDVTAAPAGSPARRRRGAAIAGLGLLLGAAVVLAVARPGQSERSRPTFTPLVTDAGYQGAPAWSPDGKTLAYVAQVDGVLQVFTRNVESSLPQQITDRPFDCNDPFWSPDGARIFFHSLAEEHDSLWSVSAGGGPPQLAVLNASNAALSPDGKTLAFLRQEVGGFGTLALWVASPPAAEPRRYNEPPFDKEVFADGWIRFSRDGSKLCVWVYGWTIDTQKRVPSGYWVLPWPDGRPREVLRSLWNLGPSAANAFDWMPDGRHLVIGLGEPGMAGRHLWLADIEGNRHEPLTATPGSENYPAVAPDGERIAFAVEAVDFDLVTVPVDGKGVQPLLTTSRNEFDPAWSPDGSQYAFVTDRTGALQISLRSSDGKWERPVVTEDQFNDRTHTLGALAFAPDGQRIAFQRLGEDHGYRVWISTMATGRPVQVEGELYSDAPSWSPDGLWLAFVKRFEGRTWLVKKRVGTPDPPVSLDDRIAPLSRLEWSPDGRWILCDTREGLALVRPDGREARVLSEELWLAYGWAADSRTVYGLREGDKRRHLALVAIDVATGAERVINPDLGIIPPANQPVRGFARTPGGFATSMARARSDIWMISGVRLPRGLLARWRSMLPWAD